MANNLGIFGLITIVCDFRSVSIPKSQKWLMALKKEKPVRLHFLRQESSMCSEMVIFDRLQKSAKLPEGETVTIEFTPAESGEIPFQCQMGMLRGNVVVEN